MRYYRAMIKGFKSKQTESVWNGQKTKSISKEVAKVALRKLRIIHAARDLTDLRIPPANHLEALKGNRRGQHSIRINDQFRICFEWRNGDAYNVEIVDYH